MIEIIDNILPEQTKLKIIKQLMLSNTWSFPGDDDIKVNSNEQLKNYLKLNQKNTGFMLLSYNKVHNINLNTPLNIYAEIIFDILKDKSKYNFNEALRFYWNYYDSSSQGNLHQDMTITGHYSIIYNLHTNDGGTEFKDDKKTFIKSKSGQAIIFPSEMTHRGVAPKKLNHRFNLNIVTYN